MSAIGVAVIIMTALTMAIGFWTYIKIKGKAVNYFKAGAAMPVWVIAITLCAQAFDANGSMGAASRSYDMGFWAGASIPVGLALCLLFTGLFFAKPIQQMNLLTLGDFYHRRYSQTTETLAVVSMLASNIILIAGNLAGLGLLYGKIFNLPYLPILIIVSVCILSYALTGGLFASIGTSVFQVAIFVIGILLAFFWITYAFGWSTLMLTVPQDHKFVSGLVSIKHGSLGNWASLVSLALGDIVALDFMQRVLSAKSPQAARRGCYSGALLTLLVGVPVAMIGLYAFHFKKISGANLLVNMAIENMPELIGIFLILGIIAASMSTAAGVILALANTIARNLVQRYKKERWNDSKMLAFSRWIAIPTMAAAVLYAYISPAPGTLLILAFDIVLAGCFVPLVLGIFWKKANAAAAISSIVLGGSLRLVLHFVVPSSLSGLDTLIPPVFSLVLFIAIAQLTQKTSVPRMNAFARIPSEKELVEGRD
ncbi:MAG TPA: hypothetical protein VMZ49_10760 [Patescibacteria group bacterium]|nr:hypothetical protein [Patescibacteria group bacterium]